ncbi:hypothetical protein EJB05_46456 [Eragrostis curvula]|uniref:Uncharacterized protein n=1 Tax=Eragrostis curvula TaxID=38414 RepID=A0A5J9TN13_9POAL|nr:hypothetical protein EJB05_46456 [Eragrostis curvula]
MDENKGSGRPLVELLSMRASLSIVGTEIVVFDGRRGQIIYKHKKEKAQSLCMQGGMIDLELTGPYTGISAWGPFAIKIDIPAAAPITWEWDCYDQERINEVDEPPRTQKIGNGIAEVTYAVMSDALEATVQIKVKLTGLPKDGHNQISFHGEVTALIDSFNGSKSFLFKRTQEAPLRLTLGDDKSWFLFPLPRNVIAVPCGNFLHIEVNLQIVEIPNKQFKANLTFGNGIQSQVNNDKDVEVNIAWYPEETSEDIGEQIVVTTPEPSHHTETEMTTAQPSHQLEQTSEEIGELEFTTAQKPIQEGCINMEDYPEMVRLIEMFQAISETNVEVNLQLIDEQHSRVYGKITALIKDERSANFQIWRGVHSFNSQLELKMSVVAVPSGWVLDVVKLDLYIENDNGEVRNFEVNLMVNEGFTKMSQTSYGEKGDIVVLTITPEVYLGEDSLPFGSQLSGPVEVKTINGHLTVVYTIGDELSFTEFIMILRRILADHPDRKDFLDGYCGPLTLIFSTREHPMLAKQRSGQPARSLHVRLQVVNGDGKITSWTTLIMRDDNLGFLGFANQDGDVYVLANVIKGSEGMQFLEHAYHLNWTVNYTSDLVDTLLQMGPSCDFAKKAVHTLSRYSLPTSAEEGGDDDHARVALAGLIVMVRESAAMNPFHDAFVAGWSSGSGFSGQLMNSHRRHYGRMSCDLQIWKKRDYAEPIRDLSPASRNWRVRVRVARAWEYCGGQDAGSPLHIDLVLVDEHGDAIYAEVPGKEVDKFKGTFKEGHVYTFSKFLVANMKPAYRPLESKYMVRITPWTRVDHVASVSDDFPRFVFRLVSLSELDSRVGNQEYFTDVLGTVIAVSKVSHVRLSSSSSDTARRTILIKDLSGFEVKLVLWGNRAIEFDAEGVFEMGQEHHVVGIFVGLLVKSYRGDTCLSGGDACRWYLNESIAEIEEAYDRLGDDVCKIVWSDSDDSFASSGRRAADLENMTVAALREVDPWNNESISFSCTVTVARVNQDQKWWFMSCAKCHRAANPYGSEFRCSGDCGNVNATPKYRLCLVCGDSTGAAEFVLFGRVAQQVIGKPVMTLMRCDGLPREIAAIVTQKFAFVVTVSRKSLTQRNVSFQVNSVETFFGRQACVPDLRVFDGERVDGSPSQTVVSSQESVSTLRARPERGLLPTLAKRKLIMDPPSATDGLNTSGAGSSSTGVSDVIVGDGGHKDGRDDGLTDQLLVKVPDGVGLDAPPEKTVSRRRSAAAISGGNNEAAKKGSLSLKKAK